MPAAESSDKGSEQDEETELPVRIKFHQTSIGKGRITVMPEKRAINILEDIKDKCSVAQQKKISNKDVMIGTKNEIS